MVKIGFWIYIYIYIYMWVGQFESVHASYKYATHLHACKIACLLATRRPAYLRACLLVYLPAYLLTGIGMLAPMLSLSSCLLTCLAVSMFAQTCLFACLKPACLLTLLLLLLLLWPWLWLSLWRWLWLWLWFCF